MDSYARFLHYHFLRGTDPDVVPMSVVRCMPASEDLYAALELKEMQQAVQHALSLLKPREQDVIRQRFGFDLEPKTQRAIGAQTGITGTTIQHIEQKALRKLSHPKISHKLAPFWPREMHQRFENALRPK